MNIKEIKSKNDLKNTDIAKMFGYKNLESYQNSTAKKRIEQGLELFYDTIVSNIKGKI